MGKVLAVAQSEYLTAVRSKAFVVGVLLMPVLMFGSIVVMHFAEDQADTRDRRLAVVDETGELHDVLARAADERNARAIFEDQDPSADQVEPRFLLERVAPAPAGDEPARSQLQLDLSDRIRSGELFAYLVLDPGVVSLEPGRGSEISYYTETPTYGDLPDWISGVLNEEIRRLRFAREPGLDPAVVARVTRQERVKRLGLTGRTSAGEIVAAKEENEFANQIVPLCAMMLLFMLVMTTTPYMLNAVLEEKMQKISEVLVSAVSPFRLMLGKLLAGGAVSLTLSFLYLGAVFYLTHRYDVDSMVPYSMYGWFLLFQILALLIFGAIFAGLGAACTEMRDAQSMMMPAMLLVMIPMFLWGPVLRAPDSPLAVGASLFPPATPMLMMLRIAIPPGPPAWQVLTSIVLTVLFTIFCVWAAGKVFRIGILSQGKAPSFLQLARWIFTNP